MSDAKKDPKADKAAPAKKEPTPEELATARNQELTEATQKLEGELKTLKGRIKNLSPEAFAELKAENAVLKSRLSRLEKAYLSLSQDLLRPRSNEELKTQTDTLRQAAVEFCTRENINPEIWKSIVS